MLQIGSHPKLFVVARFAQPILSLYVIGLAFHRFENRRGQTECVVGIPVVAGGEGAEKGAEFVFFLPVEIDFKALDVF